MQRKPPHAVRRNSTIARRRSRRILKYASIILGTLILIAGVILIMYDRFNPTLEKAHSLLQSGNTDRGIAMLTKLAERNNRSAQLQLAEMYLKGEPIPRSIPMGRQYLEMAAYGGDITAQMQLADLLWHDEGGDAQSKYRAASFLKMAADAGKVEAMSRLGRMRYLGEGVHPDYEQAREYIEKAAKAGDIPAIGLLGRMQYLGHGMPVDREKAEENLHLAADSGDAMAAAILGKAYMDRAKTDSDYILATQYLEQAVVLQDTEGQAALGELFYKGLGVPKDMTKAIGLLTPAAESGNAGAQYTLACALLEGGDVSRESSQAVELMRRSAEQNYLPALLRISDLYLAGDIIEKNPLHAEHFLKRAADQGNSEAQRKLGKLYLYGDGSKYDRDGAMALFEKAAHGGDQEAEGILNQQKARMAEAKQMQTEREKSGQQAAEFAKEQAGAAKTKSPQDDLKLKQQKIVEQIRRDAEKEDERTMVIKVHQDYNRMVAESNEYFNKTGRESSSETGLKIKKLKERLEKLNWEYQIKWHEDPWTGK